MVAFAVYLRTLAPSIPGGDSGELIAAAFSGGVAHPPGYPLYVLVGRAWITLVPLGTIAWRMNLWSAVCAALAVTLLAAAVQRLTRSNGAALTGAWLLAFAPPLWKNAVVTEVFALHALLAAGMMLACVRLLLASGVRTPGHGARATGPSPRTSRATGAILGLAYLNGLLVAHHHSLLLLALPIDLVTALLLWGPDAWRRRLAPGTPRAEPAGPALFVGGALALLLGLSPLAGIPILAARDPALSWGDVHGARDFLRLLSRADFGTFQLDARGAALVADRGHIGLYLKSLPRDLGLLGLLLLIPGALALTRLRPLAAVLLGFAGLQALFFTRVHFPSGSLLLRGVVERFYLLPDLVLAFIAGLGAAWMLARAGPRLGTVLSAAFAIAALVLPIARHGASVAQRDQHMVEHLAIDVLASTPRDAVLFVRGDVLHNALACLQIIERSRPDVIVLDQELMTYDWYIRQVRRRWPDVLPALGGGERFALAAGGALEGRIVQASSDSLVMRVPGAFRRLARSDVQRIDHPDPRELYAGARQAFHDSWLAPASEDRYSGLPGSENLFWIDHLRSRRPVAFLGIKDDSYALRYSLVPSGYVLLAVPRDSVPALAGRAALALDQLATFHIEDVFGAFDATSFEAAERARVAEFVAYSAALVGRQTQVSLDADHPGLRRLGELIVRAERETAPDPALLKAAALVRRFDPRLRNDARAATDFERWLATGATGPEADQARRWLRERNNDGVPTRP